MLPLPDYAKAIVREDQNMSLRFFTEDESGTICFDLFTQDTWIEPTEAAILPTTAVEN